MHINEAIGADEKRWSMFVAASPYRSFMQTWTWGEMQRALHVRHWRVVVEENGNIVATALVLQRTLKFGYSWLYVPRGPILAEHLSAEAHTHVWELLQEKFVSLAKECGAFFIRIDPLWSQQKAHVLGGTWSKSGREVQPQHTAILNLEGSEEGLFARVHPKTRYNIRLAERKGVTVEYSQEAHAVDSFLNASRVVSARSGFSYHPDAYYRTFLSTLGKAGMAELAIARVENKVVAAHIMVYADGIATYVHGASNQEKRSYMAPTLLYWETIKRAKEKNMQQYDFFGIAPEDASPDHSWSGITRIKMGFGGTRVAYIGAYDFVLNDGLYSGFAMMRDISGKVRSVIKNPFSSL